MLECGEENKILSVNEPETCKYKLMFKTPYACPKDVFHGKFEGTTEIVVAAKVHHGVSPPRILTGS